MNCPACSGDCVADREGLMLCVVCGAQEFVIPNTKHYGWKSQTGRIIAAPADQRQAHERMMVEWGDRIDEAEAQRMKDELPDA